MIAPNCRDEHAEGNYPSASLRVRPGDPVVLHVVGDRLKDPSVSLAPNDVANAASDVEMRGAEPWSFSAPDHDAVVMFSARGANGAGQASYVACLDVHGAKPASAKGENSLGRSEAILRFTVETNGQQFDVVPDSLQCIALSRPKLSASKVWRCSALVRPEPGSGLAARWYSTIAANGSTENGSDRVRVVGIYDVTSAKPKELIAVRGIIIGSGHDFVLCATAYMSLPPKCGDTDAPGALPLIDYDPAAHALETSGNARFSVGTVVVFGRMRGRELVIDDAT